MSQPLCFGHFEVQTRSDGSPLVLGRGAMGVTYKAFDQVLLSPAVVKVASSEHQASSAGRQRFLKEAQMLARVRHPHIASVFFFGDSPSGAFFAMEYCEGPNLSDYIAKTGPMRWQDAFCLGVQAASALQALAENELVHRDLKPSNFVLTRDTAGNAFLKLIDFGIAREGMRADSEGLTLTGFVGTPAYASPEQLLESGDLDSRSDLYSLGSVLWFCLTGKPPFEGSQFEVMFHHANTQPDWRKLPEMPEAARAVLARLMEKSPADRFESPSELVHVLQATLPAGTDVTKLRLSFPESEGDDFGAYEPIEKCAEDSFGTVWRAKDTLTGNTVSLRLLPEEVASKSTLMLRLERLAAFLRASGNPRWQNVWHFEHDEKQARLALEWVDGPTLLNVLDVRRTLAPAETAPLFAQIADALDTAAAAGITTAETAPERIWMAVSGWDAMDADARKNLLATSPSEWPETTVKVCPIGLSKSAQDYLLPADITSAQASVRPGKEFVSLCFRVLTGQTQGGTHSAPNPALKPATCKIFEKYLGGKSTYTSCVGFLRELCVVEGLQVPSLPTSRASLSTTAAIPAAIAGTAPSHDAPTVIDPMPPGPLPASASPAAVARMRELEERRAKLEADAELLKEKERIFAEQEWLAREKQALEAARNDFSQQEARRRQQIEAEQQRIGELRNALASQQELLEQKQAEQQRLEREIQSRAKDEFQKMQVEAEALRAELQGRDAKLADALRERDAEFQSREQQNLARVEQLKREAESLQRQLDERAALLRKSELEQDRRSAQEKADDSLTREALEAEERRLELLRSNLDLRLADWERVQKKRMLALFAAALVAIALAVLAAHYVKGRVVNFSALPGEEQWKVALEQSKRAREEKNWPALFDWCVTTDESLRAKPEFAEALKTHQAELAALASESVRGIISAAKLPDATSEEGRRLLLNLAKTDSWSLVPERSLLVAKLRMPEAVSRNAGMEALKAYLGAANSNPVFASTLRGELEATFASLRKQLLDERLSISQEIHRLTDEVIKAESATGGAEAKRFRGELLTEEARRNGDPGEALRRLLDTLELNPDWKEALRPQAVKIISQIVKLPAPELLPAASSLRTAGETWKVADAFLALAEVEPDVQARADDYKSAELLGSTRARALVGRMLLDRGVEGSDPVLVSQGAAKLREAVEAGEPEAMVLLGEALAFGRGVKENATEALDLATRAESKGHPEAYFLAAKARLRLGVSTGDATMIAKAAEGFEKAAAANLPGSHYFLYLSNYTKVANDPVKALAALEKGAVARDRNCMFVLGKWLYSGTAPAVRNPTRGRELILEAAKQGSDSAREWLQANPL